MADEKIIYEVEIDQASLNKQVVELQKRINGLKAEQRDLNKAFKEGSISAEEYAKEQVRIKQELKSASTEQRKYNRQIELADKATKANANSLEQLSSQYSLAVQQLKSMEDALERNEDGTLQVTQAYLDQAETVKELKDSLDEANSALGNNTGNVGNYGEAIREAIGANVGFVDGFDNLKKSLISNPIGLVALAVAGLVSVTKQLFDQFSETKRGSDLLAESSAALTAVVKPLKDVVFQLFENGTRAFNSIVRLAGGMDGDLSPAIKFATAGLQSMVGLLGLAADGLEALEEGLGLDNENLSNAVGLIRDLADEQRELEVQSRRLIKEEEALKNIRDDETQSIADRIAANEELGRKETERIQALIANQQKTIRALELRNDLLGDQQLTQEQINEVVDARRELEDLQEESIGRQNEQIVNQVQLKRELVDIQNEINASSLELEILQGKIVEGSREELERRKESLRLQAEADIQAAGDNAERRKLLETNLQVELLKLDKDFNNAQAQQYQEYLSNRESQAKDTQARINREALAALELELLKTQENSEEQLNATIALEEKKKDIALQNADLTASERSLIEEQFQINRAKRENDFAEARLKEIEQQVDEEAAQRKRVEDLEIKRLQNRIEAERQAGRQALEERENLAIAQREQADRLAREAFAAEEITEAELQERIYENQLEFNQRMDELDGLRLAEKEKLIEAERELEQLRVDAYTSSLNAIASIAGEQSAIGKGLFLAEQSIAVAQVALNLQEELSNIATNASAFPEPLATITRIIKITEAVARGSAIISKMKNVSFADGGPVGTFGMAGSVGGYTGDGTKYQPKGIVHANEVVFSQKDVSLMGGVMNVEKIRPTSGYVDGGVVGSEFVSAAEETTRTEEAVSNAVQEMPAPVLSLTQLNEDNAKLVRIEERAVID